MGLAWHISMMAQRNLLITELYLKTVTSTTIRPFTTMPLTSQVVIVPVVVVGNTTNVSMIFGASDLGNKSYDPDPVKVRVGDTVTWINDDLTIHFLKSLPAETGIAGTSFDAVIEPMRCSATHLQNQAGIIIIA